MGVSIEFSDQFLQDAEQIYSPKVADELRNAISLFEIIPTIGSKIVRQSLKEEFGEDIYKWVVGPFDLIYTFNEDLQTIQLHALLPQKMVR